MKARQNNGDGVKPQVRGRKKWHRTTVSTYEERWKRISREKTRARASENQ
jgi:hypothetical protein